LLRSDRDGIKRPMIGLRDEAGPGGAERALRDWRPLVAQTFAAGGWLEAALQLEHRPQQERMALAVAQALDTDEPLLFEAGTGVGKSLAYLMPGLLHAQIARRPLVVSTHTIALQEQIQNSDLVLCRRLFAAVPALREFADFRATLLLGKANYLCHTRLGQALEARTELVASADQQELERIAAWARDSREGLRQELNPLPPPEIWEWVHADSSVCNRKNCHPDTCPYRRARARLEKAHLVVVNHSLLFSLLQAGGARAKGAERGILLADDSVVLDEAHTVPEIATEHFGLRLTSFGVERLLRTLYHPERQRGLLQRLGGARERQLVADCLEAARQFFGFVRERVLDRQPVVRIHEEDTLEPLPAEPFKILAQCLGQVGDRLEDGPLRDELLEQRGRLQQCHQGIRQFLTLAAEDHVHWVERSGKAGQIVALRSAPVDVAPALREALFRRETAAILTSATLALGGDLTPFQLRCGAERLTAAIADSPFDYATHLRTYVAADAPAPGPGDARLALEPLAEWIGWCTTRVPGGSLVLFTSYADMNAVAAHLADTYRAADRPLFVQGKLWSRSELTRRFKAAGNAVLFGTDSFWTGVDVPGPALSQVVVVRLPFDVPTHPITEARAEWVRDRGGNPFAEITLPDALVKFRQGIGRLIRTHTDRGVITVLDARVLHKSYGRLFLQCLPHPTYQRLTRADRDQLFRPFPVEADRKA
jgi:ATP-dependent DNA helicase DinG